MQESKQWHAEKDRCGREVWMNLAGFVDWKLEAKDAFIHGYFLMIEWLMFDFHQVMAKKGKKGGKGMKMLSKGARKALGKLPKVIGLI